MPMSTYTPITLADLTTATTDGTGVFDVLMQANKAHLEQEFRQGRIKGNEYATVYLGSLQTVLQGAIEFTLQKQKQSLEVALVAKQVELAQEQILKTRTEVELVQAQIAKLKREDALVAQQLLNMQAEALNIPKQGAVLVAQECKLRGEFDLIKEQVIKTSAETSLLNQRKVTEQAQTTGMGVDLNSVIGRQKALYEAQTEGFQRDAEQKAADLMIKSWATRRTTDEGTVADGVNMLNDVAIGRAVNKLLSGVGA